MRRSIPCSIVVVSVVSAVLAVPALAGAQPDGPEAASGTEVVQSVEPPVGLPSEVTLTVLSMIDQEVKLGARLARLEKADEGAAVAVAVGPRIESVGVERQLVANELVAVRARLSEFNPGQEWGIGVAVFPVTENYEFVNSWGMARSGGRRHKGTDILAPRGTEILAIESGTIERYSRNSLGGNSFYYQGDSGARYYYAHLDRYGPQAEGDHVEVGAVIGYVGDTGNARGTPHLHFQWAPSGGEAWTNPYPLLRDLSTTLWPRGLQLQLPPVEVGSSGP